MRISIESHTDASGSEDRNLAISKKRAEEIFIKFMGMGISEDKMVYEGFGKEFLLESGDSQDIVETNRRNIILFINIDSLQLCYNKAATQYVHVALTISYKYL